MFLYVVFLSIGACCLCICLLIRVLGSSSWFFQENIKTFSSIANKALMLIKHKTLIKLACRLSLYAFL